MRVLVLADHLGNEVAALGLAERFAPSIGAAVRNWLSRRRLRMPVLVSLPIRFGRVRAGRLYQTPLSSLRSQRIDASAPPIARLRGYLRTWGANLILPAWFRKTPASASTAWLSSPIYSLG